MHSFVSCDSTFHMVSFFPYTNATLSFEEIGLRFSLPTTKPRNELSGL